MATGGSFHMPQAVQRRKRKFRQNNNVLGLSKHAPSQKPLADFISFCCTRYVHQLRVHSRVHRQVLQPILTTPVLQLQTFKEIGMILPFLDLISCRAWLSKNLNIYYKRGINYRSCVIKCKRVERTADSRKRGWQKHHLMWAAPAFL